MKTIPLTKGYVAQVDDEDFDALVSVRWCAQVLPGGLVYAARYDGAHYVYMHRVILGVTSGLVDHENGNGLDNQRANLRPATKSTNAVNAKLASNNSSGYRGVYRQRGHCRWHARVTVQGTVILLGTFDTAEEAARARDAAALQHFGPFARLNFPARRAVMVWDEPERELAAV